MGSSRSETKVRWLGIGFFPPSSLALWPRHHQRECNDRGIISFKRGSVHRWAHQLIFFFFFFFLSRQRRIPLDSNCIQPLRFAFLQWSAFFFFFFLFFFFNGTMHFTYQIGGVQAERWREYADAWRSASMQTFTFRRRATGKRARGGDKSESRIFHFKLGMRGGEQ